MSGEHVRTTKRSTTLGDRHRVRRRRSWWPPAGSSRSTGCTATRRPPPRPRPPPALTVASVSPTGANVAAGSTIVGAVLDRPGAEQPDADAVPARRRRVGRAVAVAARVPGERPARAGRHRDGHRPRRGTRASSGSEGPAPGADRHVTVHRRARIHPAPPAAAGRARLPPAHVHAGVPADLAHPGGQRPGGLVHLALARPAALAR